MEKETPVDLRTRTGDFALRIIRLYVSLPKTTGQLRRRFLENKSFALELPLARITVKVIAQNPTPISSINLRMPCKNLMKPITGWNCL
ncbi:MAG: hypothetical protein PHQ36_09720 [Anaerolineales bacterium]|nr:hypothetical protein [Anaerolineales bacterium]